MSERVPVMSGFRCLERADAARVARLVRARNVVAIRRHKDGEIVELQVSARGDDSEKRARGGNPLAYSYDGEAEDNPPNVWALKRIPNCARRVFTAVVDDCAA